MINTFLNVIKFDSNMRLNLIIPSLGTGGAERVGVLLANGFALRGHEVVVFSNLNHSKDYQLENNILIVDLSKEGKGRIEKWWHVIHVVRKNVKDNPPDLFIGIMGVFSLLAYLACIGLNVPVISTMHNSFERPSYAPMSKLEWYFKFVVNKIYKIVTLLTHADASFIEKKLKNTVVMPNPLALTPAKSNFLRNNNILAAGRLNDWHYKGFDVLIRAWGKISNSEQLIVNREGWKLQIAGTGSEESLNYLKGLCKENGVEDSVEFLGFQKDIEKLYQKASIFVLSSRYEGFGLVLIEAMSQGCACIACDYKGRQKEILCPDGQVSGSKFKVQSSSFPTEGCGDAELETRNSHVEVCETGILCEPDDVDALAEAMRKMMTDDQYRESVRMKAVERSKYYSLENTMDRWEYLLNQLVEK